MWKTVESSLAVTGSLIIKYKYLPKNIDEDNEKLKFNPGKYKWNFEYGEYTNMAMLHLHSLEPISYLLLGYYYEKKKEYLEESFKIVFDLLNHSLSGDHFYLWYRHCVSDRAVILSQLLFLYKEVDLESDELDRFYKLIVEHKHYLSKDENYKLHNHGILMDLGLFALGLSTKDEVSKQISLKRGKNNFEQTFTSNMICAENSISFIQFIILSNL